MQVALYARVSTNDQSTDMQLKDLREYCAARGFEVYREYIDHGISGSKKSRPALNNLMADAAKRKFKACIVWRFDRFARSTKHLVAALEEFRDFGIDFISFNENIDTGSPMGQAIFTILAAISQLERDIIRERVRGGLRNAKAKGTRLGRPPVNPYLSELCARHKDKGWSNRKIAAELGVGRSTVDRALKPKE